MMANYNGDEVLAKINIVQSDLKTFDVSQSDWAEYFYWFEV